jgi:predicted aspartyl protease
VGIRALALLVAAPLLTPVQEAPAWHAFELFRDGYLYAPGQVNGEPVEMVLDTGAGITVLSTELAERLELERGRTIQAQGVGGLQSARLVEGVRIELAGTQLGALTVAVIDLSGVEKHIGRDMPLILGRELFAEHVVDIDYPGRRLAVRPPADYTYDGPGRTVELYRRGTGRQVEARVEGLPAARFAVDTGSGGTLALFEDYTERHGLLEGRAPLSDVNGGGVGGRISLRVGSLRGFRFAGYDLGPMPVSFHEGDEGAFGSIRAAGNLGTAVFRRFRLVFDAPHGKLHVEPGPGWDEQTFRRNRAGIQVVWLGDALEVMHVAAGSPAEAAGWKAGERITAIDGRAVDASYYRELWLWGTGEDGREVVLRDGAGRERRLVLATYY